MSTAIHDLSQLDNPVAQQLLSSTAPARLAYTWSDGTPRVVPSGSTGTVKRSCSAVHPKRRS